MVKQLPSSHSLTRLLSALASVTHKKIDAGPLLVAPVPRSRRRTANAPLEVHLSGARFARLLQVAAELVPKLRRLLADISRQRNFFGVVRLTAC
jgi:hypothetical protein